MPGAHREHDKRVCDAETIVEGQSTVFVNGRLWSVDRDPNDHTDGNLIPGLGGEVYISGKRVIVLGDHADPDALCFLEGPPHCDPYTVEASGDVFSGGS